MPCNTDAQHKTGDLCTRGLLACVQAEAKFGNIVSQVPRLVDIDITHIKLTITFIIAAASLQAAANLNAR